MNLFKKRKIEFSINTSDSPDKVIDFIKNLPVLPENGPSSLDFEDRVFMIKNEENKFSLAVKFRFEKMLNDLTIVNAEIINDTASTSIYFTVHEAGLSGVVRMVLVLFPWLIITGIISRYNLSPLTIIIITMIGFLLSLLMTKIEDGRLLKVEPALRKFFKFDK